MEFWLDTIDTDAIEEAQEMGLLYGVTTNPTLLAQAALPAEDVLEDLLTRFHGPLAVQVTLHTAHEMIEQAKDLYDFSPRIVTKIPATPQGFQAIYNLRHIDLPTMATAVLDPIQGALAAQAGAKYIAPYFDHMGEKALDSCLTLQRMLDLHNMSSKLLIASLRTSEQVSSCLAAGFAAITLKAPVFHRCLEVSPEVRKQLDRFEADWKKAPVSKLLTAAHLIK